MACAATKFIQTVWACISGTLHHGLQRQWVCTGTQGGIQYSWTEWRFENGWTSSGSSCGDPPTDTPLEYTQVALLGQQMEPTHQRLHQYCVIVPNVGPQTWLGWIDEPV